MQVKRETSKETSIKLTIQADQAQLAHVKQEVLSRLGRTARVQGFRPGKAPLNLVEKQIDPNALQTEFLEQAVNLLYMDAIEQEKLRPVAQPEIAITKFVPFTDLEITVETEVIGAMELPEYKHLKLARPAVTVTQKDVDDVIENLKTRAAAKDEVARASKTGDEVTIDFAGVDAQTKEPIQGADGKDYPLLLGSNTFIPGFEDNLVDLKPGASKTFTLTFPKDYGVNALRSRKVTFAVTVTKVQQLVPPKLDAAFAASVGPFKTMAELKADIKKQLEAERHQEAERDYENRLLQEVADNTKVAIPESLVESEIDRIEEEEKRNLVYRGQTWQEHLEQEGLTEAEHRERNREGAALRVKAGLILTELADREGITVTPEELEIRMQLLKGQYTDATMQAELDKPESRRDILSRMVTEKTLDKLKSYAGTPTKSK